VQCAYLLRGEGAARPIAAGELLAKVRSGDAMRGLVLLTVLGLRGVLERRGAKLRGAGDLAAGVLKAVLLMLSQAVPALLELLLALLLVVLMSCSWHAAVASSVLMFSSSVSTKLLVAAASCSSEMLLISKVRTVPALSTGVTGAVGAASHALELIAGLLSAAAAVGTTVNR
jgi:hypothetical protein